MSRLKGVLTASWREPKLLSLQPRMQLQVKSFTAPVTADVMVDPDVNRAAHIVLDDQEIQRRRDLVRMLFNDFWSAAYEKPAGFVERLDQAEDYVNDRLAANGEAWRLDSKTRVMLGLPPRVNTDAPL